MPLGQLVRLARALLRFLRAARDNLRVASSSLIAISALTNLNRNRIEMSTIGRRIQPPSTILLGGWLSLIYTRFAIYTRPN